MAVRYGPEVFKRLVIISGCELLNTKVELDIPSQRISSCYLPSLIQQGFAECVQASGDIKLGKLLVVLSRSECRKRRLLGHRFRWKETAKWTRWDSLAIYCGSRNNPNKRSQSKEVRCGGILGHNGIKMRAERSDEHLVLTLKLKNLNFRVSALAEFLNQLVCVGSSAYRSNL